MASGDLLARGAGRFAGSAHHAGTGAQVVLEVSLDDLCGAGTFERAFVFLLTCTTIDTGGVPGAIGAILVQRRHVFAYYREADQWAVESGLHGDTLGTLTDPSWTVEDVGGVLTVSCTCATTGADAVSSATLDFQNAHEITYLPEA